MGAKDLARCVDGYGDQVPGTEAGCRRRATDGPEGVRRTWMGACATQSGSLPAGMRAGAGLPGPVGRTEQLRSGRLLGREPRRGQRRRRRLEPASVSRPRRRGARSAPTGTEARVVDMQGLPGAVHVGMVWVRLGVPGPSVRKGAAMGRSVPSLGKAASASQASLALAAMGGALSARALQAVTGRSEEHTS